MVTTDARIRSHTGFYGISATAKLMGVDPTALRQYERHKLLVPVRTARGTRRYSNEDLVMIHRIGRWTALGVNLTGVAHILRLEAKNAALEAEAHAARAGWLDPIDIASSRYRF